MYFVLIIVIYFVYKLIQIFDSFYYLQTYLLSHWYNQMEPNTPPDSATVPIPKLKPKKQSKK